MAEAAVAAAVPREKYTVEEALVHIGFGRTQVIMFLFVGIAWAGDGMEMMLLSYLGPEESWITSVVFIGMMIGSYSWGAISDRYGRKIGYFAPAVFTAAFGILSATAPTYGALLFFRGCVGFGIAGAHVAYTLFMEYIAPAHRGLFLSLIEGFWTLGSIFLAGMAWVVLPTRGWRALVLVAAAPLIILVAVYPFLKESPHWLLATGKVKEAQAVLEWVAATNGKEMPPGHLVHHSERHSSSKYTVELAVRAPGEAIDPPMEPQVAQPQQVPEAPVVGVTAHCSSFFNGIGSSFRRMVSTPELLVTSALLAVVWVAVALSYYGTILFGVEMQTERGEECVDGSAPISSDDFREVFVTSLGELVRDTNQGLFAQMQKLDSFVYNEIGGLVLCMGLVDTIGRRRCLWLFMIGASIFTTPLLRADAPNPGDANGSLDIIALFCTRMFAYGAFIVLFIYTPELYPTKIRSFAFGLYNALSRLGGLVSPFIAVDLFQKAGAQAAAGTFLGASVLAAIVAMFLPIETMGIDLPEDTDDMHSNDKQQRFDFAGSSKGRPDRAMSAAMPQVPVKDGQTADTANPFATAENLAPNSRAEEYQDQYGLDSTAEQ